ncbi:MAG: peptide-methionine (S)-S-oxide reductase MsrA [Flavobacteriales bacterium]|nr:peptide-methionine (S)-S-oxide reductase MsrA [Flavobacteriales bacterium]
MQKSFYNFQNKKNRKSVLKQTHFKSAVLLFSFLSTLCVYALLRNKQSKLKIKMSDYNLNKNTFEKATFGAGCFWCTESIFMELKGVESVFPGYMGGKLKNPTYKEVCSSLSGHAEVVQITYDPSVIAYVELLEVFFLIHDPTTLNRQGADVGSQYRSVIFYHYPYQKEKVDTYTELLSKSGAFENKIVTEITEALEFYRAEKEHLNYYNLNKQQPYCKAIIQPKLEKFRKVFADKTK